VDGQYALRDLVALTGFSPRQIRFYITERLVPGAGDDRGPNTTYPQETLDRLKLIVHFKAIPLPPANRTMTLDEIRRTLDGMSPEEIRRRAQGEEMPRVEMRALPSALFRSVAPPPDEPMEAYCLSSPMLDDGPGAGPDDPEIRPLLHQTERLMTDVARHRAPWRRTPEDTWRCVKTPLLEIHVKEPAHDRERTQLRRLAEALSQLLGEEKP
jgi:DNA-binding transcriptional MerR regulator